MVVRGFLFVFFSIFLGGCTTGYHSMDTPFLNYTGGYWDRQGLGRLTIVGFTANAYSNSDKVANNVMYRCAEIAKMRHKPYFSFYASVEDAITENPSDSVSVHKNYGKPDGYGYVIFHDEEKPGALSAKAVMEKYETYIRRF